MGSGIQRLVYAPRGQEAGRIVQVCFGRTYFLQRQLLREDLEPQGLRSIFTSGPLFIVWLMNAEPYFKPAGLIGHRFFARNDWGWIRLLVGLYHFITAGLRWVC